MELGFCFIVIALFTYLWQFVELVARLVAVYVNESALHVEHPIVVLMQEVPELSQQPLVIFSVASLRNVQLFKLFCT